MTGFGAPGGDLPPEARHAREAATQARGDLLVDGPAPSTVAILREMGRDADGRAVEPDADGPTQADAAARRLLDLGTDDDLDGERCDVSGCDDPASESVGSLVLCHRHVADRFIGVDSAEGDR